MDIKDRLQLLSDQALEQELYLANLINSRVPYIDHYGFVDFNWKEDIKSEFFDTNNPIFDIFLRILEILIRFRKLGITIDKEEGSPMAGKIEVKVDEKKLTEFIKNIIIEIQKRKGLAHTDFCTFPNNIFYIKSNSDDDFSMPFSNEKGGGKSINLFSTLFNYWRKEAKPYDGWMIATVPRAHIIKELKTFRYQPYELTSRSISIIIGNLRTKIESHKLEPLIKIKYNSLTSGYALHIKQPVAS